MRQNVHPAVFVAAIVVVLGIVAFFGYRAVTPSRSQYKLTQQQYEQQMKAHMGDNAGGPGYPGRSQGYQGGRGSPGANP